MNPPCKRVHLTEEQRYLIKFLSEENGLDAKEIREHSKMRRPDGSVYQLKVCTMYTSNLLKWSTKLSGIHVNERRIESNLISNQIFATKDDSRLARENSANGQHRLQAEVGSKAVAERNGGAGSDQLHKVEPETQVQSGQKRAESDSEVQRSFH